MQDPRLPLPQIGKSEKEFSSRRAYLNARAQAAGYKNYNEWLKARRAIGVPKGPGGRKKGEKQYQWAIAVRYNNHIIEGGKVEYDDKFLAYLELDEEELTEIIKSALDLLENEHESPICEGDISEIAGKKKDIEAAYENSDWILVGLRKGRKAALAGLALLMVEYQIDNYGELIGNLIAKGYNELEEII